MNPRKIIGSANDAGGYPVNRGGNFLAIRFAMPALANDHQLGLSLVLFTDSHGTAMYCTNSIESGEVCVARFPAGPQHGFHPAGNGPVTVVVTQCAACRNLPVPVSPSPDTDDF